MKRVRVEEYFLDFDKLRRGKVTKTQFESILSMLNFNFTKGEFDQMADKYRTDDPEFMINYKAFCHSINSAFTTYGI
jgi:Ca2+-binding EF-hand superfamily protein